MADRFSGGGRVGEAAAAGAGAESLGACSCSDSPDAMIAVLGR